MKTDFEADLPQDLACLCDEIVQAAAARHLPVKRKPNFLGFGCVDGFYMFWLARQGDGRYFKARCAYRYGGPEETVCFELTAENRQNIFAAIEAICRDYEAHRSPLGEAAERAWNTWRAAEPKPVDPARFGPHAAEFSRLLEQQLQVLLCALPRVRVTERDREIWKAYVLADEQDLPGTYGLSRERIRQIVRRVGFRVVALFRMLGANGAEAEICRCNAQMIAALNTVANGALPSFLNAAFLPYGRRKKAFLLALLFGPERGEVLAGACAAQKKIDRSAGAQAVALAKAEQLQAAVQYPTGVFADTSAPIRFFEAKTDYSYIARFRSQLESMKEHLRYWQNPDIVYYTSPVTVHRPDFLLEFPNGRRALVLVVPVMRMAVYYNAVRFRALHDFCAQNGYGYLITDERHQTTETLRQLPVPPALRAALNSILQSKKSIVWEDILALKQTSPVANAVLAAYILQENLKFTLTPRFWIRSFSQENQN